MYRCTDVQMYSCTDVHMYRCTNVQMYRCRYICETAVCIDVLQVSANVVQILA